jgi:hypothetical protein
MEDAMSTRTTALTDTPIALSNWPLLCLGCARSGRLAIFHFGSAESPMDGARKRIVGRFSKEFQRRSGR